MAARTFRNKQDARVREPGLLLVHKMIEERRGKCALCSNVPQPI